MKKIVAALFLSVSTLCAQAQYQNNTIKPGMKAPELVLKTPQDKTLKLSELNKGRYILLDFWASWCGPCRRANPALVRLYKEYSVKSFKGAKNGFTVVSVSLDKNKDAWVKAIETDQLSWPYHMSDLGAWQSEAAKIYGVEFIPQAVLIGPDGKVIKWLASAEQAEEDLKQLAK